MVHSENSLFFIWVLFLLRSYANAMPRQSIWKSFCCRLLLLLLFRQSTWMLYKFVQFINNNCFLFTLHLNMNSTLAMLKLIQCDAAESVREKGYNITKKSNNGNNKMEAEHTHIRIKWTDLTNVRTFHFISIQFNSSEISNAYAYFLCVFFTKWFIFALFANHFNDVCVRIVRHIC